MHVFKFQHLQILGAVTVFILLFLSLNHRFLPIVLRNFLF